MNVGLSIAKFHSENPLLFCVRSLSGAWHANAYFVQKWQNTVAAVGCGYCQRIRKDN